MKILHYLRIILKFLFMKLLWLSVRNLKWRWLTWHLLVLYSRKSEECYSSLVLKEVGLLLFLQQDSSINKVVSKWASTKKITRASKTKFHVLIPRFSHGKHLPSRESNVEEFENIPIVKTDAKPVKTAQNSTKVYSSSTLKAFAKMADYLLTWLPSDWRRCDQNRLYLVSGSKYFLPAKADSRLFDEGNRYFKPRKNT